MPIDAGDVVLTFLSDTTDLDKAFDKVSDQAQGVKDDLGPVGDAVGGIGDKFKTVGTAAEGAGAATSAASGEITTGATAAAGALGNVESATIGAAGATGKLAAGAAEAGVAVEGVSTIASVVGEVIAGAFAAGVVFLFIEALFHGISALEDLDAKARAISDAWDKVDAVQKKVFEGLENSLLKAQLKTAELTDNQLEAMRIKLQLIDNVTLENLENEIKKVAAEAEKAFKDIQPGLIQRLYGFDATGEVGSKFQEISKNVEEALSPRTPQAYTQALGLLDAELSKIQVKMNELSAKDKPVTIGGFTAPGIDPTALKSYDELHVQLQRYQADIRAAQAVANQDKENAGLEEKKHKWDDAQKAAKDYATNAIAEAKLAEQAELAGIQTTKAERALAVNQGKLGAGDLAVAEVKAANDARIAHENYLQKVVDAYTKAGLASKAQAAQEELNTQKIKDAAKATEEFAKLQAQLAANEATYRKLAADSWKATYDEINKATFAEELLAKVDPFTPQIKKVLDLNNALRQASVQGFLPLNQQLAATQKAEKLLNDAGIHDGQIWLQVQAAKLKAIIALDAAEGKASKDTINQLKAVEAELKKFGTNTKSTQITFSDMVRKMEQDAKELPAAIGDAFTAVFEGQKSLGEAMIELTAHMIGKMASQWAEYFFAMAIADIWGNPAKGAAELAAAVALEAIAGALGAVGNSSGGSSSNTQWTGGTGSSSASNNGPATQAQAAPTGGQNVPHLAGGGLITGPTLAVVGDSRSGGRASEAVIPLDDPEAIGRIAATIAGHLGGQTGNTTHIHVDGMISADNMSKVVKQMDRQIAKRQARLTAGNSFRLTRRG